MSRKPRNRTLIAAIKDEKLGDVKRYLSEGEDVNAPDRYGNRPLHHAADTGDGKIVEMLLAAGADTDGRGMKERLL